MWITLQSLVSRNTQMKYLRDGGFLDMGKQFVERYGTEVLHGPFAGMKYSTESTLTRHIVPRLMGTYEMELHSFLAGLAGSYECVLDIGAAEGYYAVGLALRLGVPVYAFEADVRERARVKKMADLNGVGQLVHLCGFCSGSDVIRLGSGRAFILSDCEGYERVLFEPDLISHLRYSDLIIETHGEGTEELLMERLSGTHRLQVFASRDRSGSEYPECRFFGERSALAVCELRPAQSWICCESILARKQSVVAGGEKPQVGQMRPN
jgi:hypothetical protein